jgi:hypothetical protein
MGVLIRLSRAAQNVAERVVRFVAGVFEDMRIAE